MEKPASAPRRISETLILLVLAPWLGRWASGRDLVEVLPAAVLAAALLESFLGGRRVGWVWLAVVAGGLLRFASPLLGLIFRDDVKAEAFSPFLFVLLLSFFKPLLLVAGGAAFRVLLRRASRPDNAVVVASVAAAVVLIARPAEPNPPARLAEAEGIRVAVVFEAPSTWHYSLSLEEASPPGTFEQVELLFPEETDACAVFPADEALSVSGRHEGALTLAIAGTPSVVRWDLVCDREEGNVLINVQGPGREVGLGAISGPGD